MLDRKTPPPFVQQTGFDLLTPVRKKLRNNCDIFFIRGGNQDVVKIELVFPSGKWNEQHLGESYFTTLLLNKGTSSKSSFEIAQILDQYGAHLELVPGLDVVSVSVYALSRHLEPVIQLLKEILSEPQFPEKEFDQHKRIFLQNLSINLEKTSFLAVRAFKEKLFGAGHAYGAEVMEKEVNALQQEQLQSFYRANFINPVIFVSGKTDDKTDLLIETTFGDLGTGSQRSHNYVSHAITPERSLVTKEGAVQSSLRAGKKSINRRHPDYNTFIFALHILGGYFGSRLMKNIREEKGLTYGIYAANHVLHHDAYVTIGADVNKENIDLTFDEIRKEIKTLRTESVPEDELLTAKNHFIGSLQSEITTPFAHADKIKMIHLHSLPTSFYADMITEISRLRTEDIRRVMEAHLHEDSMLEIAVG